MIIFCMLIFSGSIISAYNQYLGINNKNEIMNEVSQNGSPNFAENVRHNFDNYRNAKITKRPVEIQILSHPSAPLTRIDISAENKRQSMRNFNQYGSKQRSYRKGILPTKQEKGQRENYRLTPIKTNKDNLLASIRSIRYVSSRKINSGSPQNRRTAFRTNFHPLNSVKDLVIARPLLKRHQNLQKREETYSNTKENITSAKSRSKKSSSDNSFIDGTLYAIELFFIFIPLATLSAIIITIINYCWRKRGKDIHSNPQFRDASEPMVRSAFLDLYKHGQRCLPNMSKSETEIWRSFIENNIDGDGDKISKRMKLERWMHQPCNCYPEVIQQKKKKISHQKRSFSKIVQSQADKQQDPSIEIKPPSESPRSNSPQNTPVVSPFASSNMLRESVDSQYSVPWSAGEGNLLNSLYTFDSHAKLPLESKEKKHRKKTKIKKSRDSELKDPMSKNVSEPFNIER
ncbi:uncharacterized protein NPIL_590241 [Nephila pilipes]|uniref:Uncharacterized protein n=1 Tax=Nephila pilipes TaxID=299642 RepID=A0A8X6NQD8_NEPPI|nr:uncharacterized protein NPIL_590241 [Nephila pilipes]